MFVRWPGRVPERATRTDLVLNVDLFPTILETTGASPHPDSPPDGRSLFTSPPRPRLFMEYLTNVESPQIPSWRAIRTQLVHYIEYPDDRTGEITFREYYDLVNDPYELVNLLGDADPTNDPSPDELALLRAQVDRDLRCRGAQGPDACP
jgi:arylsulfatase A-like enzyme